MTLKLFEDTVEGAEPQLNASIAHRILSSGFASLVGILPAVAAGITAFRISSFFATLVNAELATRAVVTARLHALNTPIVVALGISAFLAFVIALLGRRSEAPARRRRFPVLDWHSTHRIYTSIVALVR